MKKLAVSLGLITSAIINASVFNVAAQTVNDGSCLGKVGDNSIIKPVGVQEKLISVGRITRRVLGKINYQQNLLQVTCDNKNRKVKFFTASFAIQDGVNLQEAQFIFYLDGVTAKTVTINKGTIVNVTIDNINRYNSYAYDIKYMDGYTGYSNPIHIVKWQVIQKKGANVQPTSATHRQEFTIKNGNDLAIIHIYVSSNGSTHWGRDLLGGATLEQGKSWKVTLNNHSSECNYNVKVVYKNSSYDMKSHNICKKNVIRYYGHGGDYQKEAKTTLKS